MPAAAASLRWMPATVTVPPSFMKGKGIKHQIRNAHVSTYHLISTTQTASGSYYALLFLYYSSNNNNNNNNNPMFGPTILVVNPTGPSESETRRDPSDGEEAPVTPAVDVSVKEGSPAGVRVTDGEPLDSPSVAASAATVPVRKSGRAEERKSGEGDVSRCAGHWFSFMPARENARVKQTHKRPTLDTYRVFLRVF